MGWFRSSNRPRSAVHHYENFDLELHDYSTESGRERFRVRVRESPAGEQRPDEAEIVELPVGLRDQAKLLETRDLDLDGLIQLGEDLAAAILPLRARDLYNRSLDRLEDDKGLRLSLRLGAWALASLPWEYAYLSSRDTPRDQRDSTGFLCLNRRISLVRFEILSQARSSLDPLDGASIRVVALMAEAEGHAGLNLAGEAEAVQQAVRDLPGVELDLRPEATRETLQAALDQTAHIVHFAGHGRFDVQMGESYGTTEGRGFLLLEGEGGELSAEEVAMNLRGSGVRLVVLAACEGGRVDGVQAWSGVAPALVRAGTPAVVAMQYRVRDDKAIAFSRRFYQSLVSGGSVDAAVTAGRLAMFDSEEAYGRDWGAPVLYLNAKEGELFPTEQPQQEKLTARFAANTALASAAAAMAVIYYLLHFEPWLSNLVLLGGASILAIVSVLVPLLDRIAGTEIISWLRQRLQSRRATPVLLILCSLLAALGLATTSIYALPDEGADQDLSVLVDSPDLHLSESWDVRESPRRAVFFFKVFPSAVVNLDLAQSVGYEGVQRTLYPGWSIHQRVPGDFPLKQVTMVRLVPAFGVWNKFDTGEDIVLRISVNGETQLERRNPPRKAIVFGAESADLQFELGQIGEEAISELRQHLREDSRIPESQHERWVSFWSEPVTNVTSWSETVTEDELLLQPQDEVRIEVLEEGIEVFRRDISLESHGLVTVFMKKSGD